jgi:hypothetical protein
VFLLSLQCAVAAVFLQYCSYTACVEALVLHCRSVSLLCYYILSISQSLSHVGR